MYGFCRDALHRKVIAPETSGTKNRYAALCLGTALDVMDNAQYRRSRAICGHYMDGTSICGRYAGHRSLLPVFPGETTGTCPVCFRTSPGHPSLASFGSFALQSSPMVLVQLPEKQFWSSPRLSSRSSPKLPGHCPGSFEKRTYGHPVMARTAPPAQYGCS